MFGGLGLHFEKGNKCPKSVRTDSAPHPPHPVWIGLVFHNFKTALKVSLECMLRLYTLRRNHTFLLSVAKARCQLRYKPGASHGKYRTYRICFSSNFCRTSGSSLETSSLFFTNGVSPPHPSAGSLRQKKKTLGQTHAVSIVKR